MPGPHSSGSVIPESYTKARTPTAQVPVRSLTSAANFSSNMRLLPKKLHKQVIKNIKNVAGCRDTRTAKSKETRGMIEHNSEVYNHPYISFFHCTCIWKKISVGGGGGGGGGGGVVYFTVMFDHPSCFLTFCRSGIPTSCYIFYVFYYFCSSEAAALAGSLQLRPNSHPTL